MTTEETLGLFLRVAGAALLSGFVGLERESKHKPAGFRTHMLTGGAAALLVCLCPFVVAEFERWDVATGSIRPDPIRVMEAIVVGVSFIGAGTILKVPSDQRIRYLTTAASLLFATGIGITVAVRHFALALLMAGFVIVVNAVLGRLESRWSRDRKHE